MTAFDEELRTALSREVGITLEFGSVEHLTAFRIVSSQEREIEEFITFVDEVRYANRLSGPIFYAGDGLTDTVAHGDIDVMFRNIDRILGIPQHHYFVASDFSWCVSLSMEGDMRFAFATWNLDLHRR